MKTLRNKLLVKNQKGASLVSWLVYLLVAGILIQYTIKLTPYYIDDRSVRAAIVYLSEDPRLSSLSGSEIGEILAQNFREEEVNQKALNALSIKRKVGSRYVVTVDYAIDVPLIANAAIQLTFSHYLDTSKPSECCDPL
ncbi:DUF4845 domain-containing protein [Eionea flava]